MTIAIATINETTWFSVRLLATYPRPRKCAHEDEAHVSRYHRADIHVSAHGQEREKMHERKEQPHHDQAYRRQVFARDEFDVRMGMVDNTSMVPRFFSFAISPMEMAGTKTGRPAVRC